tara:strand:+ start:1537 stop:2154 length:618 start_codon:yes stop_codon:yes gene_type:complete
MNIEVKNAENTIDYLRSMKVLEQRVKDVLSGEKKELLWIIEHNHVYTAGTSSNKEDLLNPNIDVVQTNRGGKHTYHGPGQKVVYFVLDLNKRGKNIKKLITNIENCIIGVLHEYNIKSFADKKNIGIWVNDKDKTKKVGAIGIKVKKWIAYHGFSLNISNDLNKFNSIIPCGIKDKEVTSLKELGIKDFKDINKIIAEKFLDIFH